MIAKLRSVRSLPHSQVNVIIGILISLAFLAAGCRSAQGVGPEMQPSHTAQPALPTETSTPSPQETAAPAMPTLGIGATLTSEEDGMILVYVPAGEFTMGSDYQPSSDDQSPSYYDNRPQHSVTLDAFWIDQTEVTNQQYARCVSDGQCALPLSLKSPMRSSYYGDAKFDHYPVVYTEWSMAASYCTWAGRRLPTEAEWEKAARGTDARIYPWGNDLPRDDLLNYGSQVRDTTEVGSYPQGASPYGALDMAGNVWEWVNDWHDENYYQNSPTLNPQGPETGWARGLRGGSWYYREDSSVSIFRFGVLPVDFLVRSDLRSFAVPVYAEMSVYGKQRYGFGTVGFRCAMSATP